MLNSDVLYNITLFWETGVTIITRFKNLVISC